MSIADGLAHFYLLDAAFLPTDLIRNGSEIDFVTTLGAPTSNPGGAINGSVDFNQNTDGYQTGAGDLWVQPGGVGTVTFTVSTWMRPDVLGGSGQQVFLMQGAATTFGSWSLFCDGTDDQIKFAVRSAVSSLEVQVIASDFGAISAGTWYNVVGWLDGSTGELGISVNGVETILGVAHDGSMAVDANTTVTIGRHPTNTLQSFDGRLDQTGVWSRVLNPAERSRIYNGGTPANLELWIGLTHYYRMESTSTPDPNHANPGSNDLAYAGGTPASVAGKFGQGLRFDANQVLFAPDLVPTGIAGSSFTVAAWVNLTAFGGVGIQQVVGHQGSNSTNREWKLWYDGDNDTFTFGWRPNGGANTDLVGTAFGELISTGSFGLIVASIDGSAGTALVGWNDTIESGAGTTLGLQSIAAAGVGVGRHRGTGVGILNGVLDDFLVWDRALSASALTNLYGAGAGVDMLLGFPVLPPVISNLALSTPNNTPEPITVAPLVTAGDNTVDFNTVDVDQSLAGNQNTLVVPGVATWFYAAGVITFTPVPAFSGLTSLTWTVEDDTGLESNVGTIDITVAAPPQAPTISNLVLSTDHNTPEPITVAPLVTVGDNPVDFDTVDVDQSLAGNQATLVVPGVATWAYAAGVITFTPEVTFDGLASLTWTVEDNVGLESNVGTIDITVAPPVPPSITSTAIAISQGASGQVNITPLVTPGDNPVDFTSADLDLTQGGNQASIIFPTEGTWSYDSGTTTITFTPLPAFVGVSLLPYTIADTLGNVSAAGTVQATVSAVGGGGGDGALTLQLLRRRRRS